MAIEELLINGNKILVSASGMAGLGSANEIITRKIRDNFYLVGDNYSDYEEYSGIMSTRVMICAAHQANIVLRIILGEEKMSDSFKLGNKEFNSRFYPWFREVFK